MNSQAVANEETLATMDRNKDLHIILKKIDDEINDLDEEKNRVGDIVEKELRELINKYRDKIEQEGLDIEDIRSRYRNLLVIEKQEALDRAKVELNRLRKEIKFGIEA